jgi:glycosyltransferase involved in cell wall biosynthesis
MKTAKVFVVLPAYHEAETIAEVVRQVREHGFENVLVVDDGSTDATTEAAQEAGAFVIQHAVNRGAGAATQTGLDAALRLGADYIVTLDSDGQHSPAEIGSFLPPLESDDYDVVVGSRFLDWNRIPAQRRLFNFVGNLVTALLFGKWLSDTQSGFKAFTRAAAEKIQIHSNGYEFCSELVWEFRLNNLRVVEVPISVRYTRRSLRKGQSFFIGVKTFFRLVLHSLFRVK